MSATSSTETQTVPLPRAVIVAGPTASGKSALAIRIAQEFDGVIINADSQQRFRDLAILSARPTQQEMAGVPHHLFGDLSLDDSGNASEWSEKAVEKIKSVNGSGQVPVLVGGTGLYFKALMQGLAEIPSVLQKTRDAAAALHSKLGGQKFLEELAERDPITASRLAPGNTQRLLRAWEVFEGTGVPLSEWQSVPTSPPLRASYYSILLMPPRDEVYSVCDGRLRDMVSRGAVDEVKALIGQGVSLDSPVMKMIGAREFAAVHEGTRLEKAIAAAQTATRRYAKRQFTWFRHQFHADQVINAQFSETLLPEIFSNIRHFLLT